MTDLIPAGAMEKHIAFLGATGSGKTSAAKRGLVEPALAAGARVIVLDPTGAWWGLRLKADGKAKGFPIYIFGGDHGDYPLRARDAAILAETFATSSDSAIFDMSLMTVSERTTFFTEFAETIRRKNKGPLHVIIDEAHLFMPQAGAASGGAVPAMLHAGNNLVSLGRSRGLRIAMISQRPAKLHKDSLTQAQSLVAMRLMAPQDRKAIADWIADQADPERGREIIASLPSLKPGEAWVWSPQDSVLRHTKFPLPATFDSSRAPTDSSTGPELAPVDLDALKGRLTVIEDEKKANDPAALRKRIIELQNLLTMKPQTDIEALSAATEAGAQRGHELGYHEGISAGRSHIIGLLHDVEKAVSIAIAEANRLANLAFDEAAAMKKAQPKPVNVIVPARKVIDASTGQNITGQPHVNMIGNRERAERAAALADAHRRVNSSVDKVSTNLPKGELACLTAAAQHWDRGVSRPQLTVLTGYKRSSRDAYIQRLREKGLILTDGDRIKCTADGRDALGSNFQPLPTGRELREHVLRTLPIGESKVLAVLVENYPNEVERDKISANTGYQRSSRDAYLQRLSARELVTTTPGRAAASADLFD